MKTTPLSVAFVTAELTPLAKVGGLADVAGALPPVLQEAGCDVRVFLPKYDLIDTAKLGCRLVIDQLPIPMGAGTELVRVWETVIPSSSVPLYLIEHERYLGRHGIYFEKQPIIDGIGEVHRFTFFSQSIPYVLDALKWRPRVVHCQDWHTGLLPQLLRHAWGKQPSTLLPATLCTIHNLGSQGKWQQSEILTFLGMTEADLPALEPGAPDLNLLQQGIRSADMINAVSPSYAREILTVEFGEGLETDLRHRETDLFGILNGIDVRRFNPATDSVIAQRFDQHTLDQRLANKLDLQKHFGLPQHPQIPVLGLVSRLTNQKGLDLILAALPEFLHDSAQFVLLGTGVTEVEELATKLTKRFPQSVSAQIGFDAAQAQRIYAGSDMFLMPSRFEPCGLGQLIAMRYGAVPVVRATGGLRDTVTEYEATSGAGTGFTFEEYRADAFAGALRKALRLYHENPAGWRQLQLAGMNRDSSWQAAADEYVQLYQKLLL